MSVFAMQLRVEQRIFWRNPSGVFFTFVLPIVLLFVFALSGSVENVPFIAGLAIISTGFQGLAIQLAMHRDQGVLKLLMASPLRATTLVAAKAASTLVTVLIELAVVFAVAVTVFDAPLPKAPVALLVTIVLGVAMFVSMGFALASLIPTSESAPAVANAAYLGMLLVSGVIAAVDGLPDTIHTLGDLLPLGPLVTGIDDAWLGPYDGMPWQGWLTMLAWTAIAVAWTTRRFRWEPADER